MATAPWFDAEQRIGGMSRKIRRCWSLYIPARQVTCNVRVCIAWKSLAKGLHGEYVKRLSFRIQHGPGDLHFFPGKLLGLFLIIEPVNLIFHNQYVKAAHFFDALPGAAFGIIAEIAFPDHCIVGAVEGMNVKGTLAVRDFPLEIEYYRVFVLAKRARNQQ